MPYVYLNAPHGCAVCGREADSALELPGGHLATCDRCRAHGAAWVLRQVVRKLDAGEDLHTEVVPVLNCSAAVGEG